MGWGRTLLLGDIGNRLDIEDTEQDIARLRREIAGAFRKDLSQDDTIKALVAENAELKLVLASLIRLLASKGTILKDELRAMVEMLDAEDGPPDGQYDGAMV